VWWGHERMYATEAEVLGSADLVDLEPLRRGGQLGFRYRRQAEALLARATRAAERCAWPGRTPRTAGLRFVRTRPEAVVLLNRLSADFAMAAPPGTPPLSRTSSTCARSAMRPCCRVRIAPDAPWISRSPGSGGSTRTRLCGRCCSTARRRE